MPAPRPLHGVGGQFNVQLFEANENHPNPIQTDQRKALLNVIGGSKFGHSRIFVPQTAIPHSEELSAVLSTVQLAHDAGVKSVNLTWHSGPYFDGITIKQPDGKPCVVRTPHGAFAGPRLMSRFVDVIELARRTTPAITHVTIQNEVNSVDIGCDCKVATSQDVYRRLYELLDAELHRRPDPQDPSQTLRDAVGLVGGDLVLKPMAGLHGDGGQDAWVSFMHEKMAHVLDGYSIHVYWAPAEFPGALQDRLQKLQGLMQDTLSNTTHELFVTEYGVRKVLAKVKPGTLVESGVETNIEDTIEGGFQHAWFNAHAPHFGFTGLTKWALYRTDGPKPSFGHWGMIGAPSESFSKSPAYHATALFNLAVGERWTATSVFNKDGLLVSRFDGPGGPNGSHSVFVLNGSSSSQEVHIHDLRKNGQYSVAVWNAHDDGKVTTQEKLPSDANGVAVVTLRKRRMVVLSTNPLSVV